ncbi:ankyrin repeat-containing domain protein [Peziza echinospora]|nr:ankyrin repeat-containing domain protein [Peziza echinospora]
MADSSEASEPASRNHKKCHWCRDDKKKCTRPNKAEWPVPCERCELKGRPCTKDMTKNEYEYAERFRANPTLGVNPWNDFRINQSLLSQYQGSSEYQHFHQQMNPSMHRDGNETRSPTVEESDSEDDDANTMRGSPAQEGFSGCRNQSEMVIDTLDDAEPGLAPLSAAHMPMTGGSDGWSSMIAIAAPPNPRSFSSSQTANSPNYAGHILSLGGIAATAQPTQSAAVDPGILEALKLEQAVASFRLKDVKKQCAAGADVNLVKRDGKGLLHIALESAMRMSSDGYSMVAAVIHELLQAKIDVNSTDNQGRTPIHLILDWPSDESQIPIKLESLKILFQQAANAINFKHTDSFGRTLLHRKDWDLPTFTYLEERLRDHFTIFVNLPDDMGRIPLHYTQKERIVFEYLLGHTKNICTVDKSGKTPLDAVLEVPAANIAVNVNKLLKQGAYKSLSILPPNAIPTLHNRITSRQALGVLLRKEFRADVNIRDSNGRTPLHHAILRLRGAEPWNWMMATVLITDAGANVNTTDNDVKSPLLSLVETVFDQIDRYKSCPTWYLFLIYRVLARQASSIAKLLVLNNADCTFISPTTGQTIAELATEQRGDIPSRLIEGDNWQKMLRECNRVGLGFEAEAEHWKIPPTDRAMAARMCAALETDLLDMVKLIEWSAAGKHAGSRGDVPVARTRHSNDGDDDDLDI